MCSGEVQPVGRLCGSRGEAENPCQCGGEDPVDTSEKRNHPGQVEFLAGVVCNRMDSASDYGLTPGANRK